MCVADKDISKIEFLTAGLMLLDTADTSPHGIISNKVMLWNFIKTVDEDKKGTESLRLEDLLASKRDPTIKINEGQ